MSTKEKTFVVILAVLILGYVVFAMQKDEPEVSFVGGGILPPTFTWETGSSEAVNLDGQPKTSVYVKATYPNGVVEQKLVDVDSGCNALPEAEKDGAVFQCYSAGAGYKYKIIRGDDSYEVQRKRFEEAVPKQKQKVFEYEAVVEFSFTK